jgi:hypothetical protein
MMDMMLGPGSPMWTALPSVGLPYQTMIGNTPIALPVFGSPMMSGGTGGGPTGAQGLSTPGAASAAVYGYGGGIVPGAQQNLAGPGFAAPYPFAANPSTALIGHEATGLVTASSLLTAVAMRRGQPQGPTTDQEVEELLYDALDLLPGAADVEVRCENGRATLTGSVSHKRIKRDVGEIAWAIPALQDVQNNVSITSRRRARAAGRDGDAQSGGSARKQG